MRSRSPCCLVWCLMRYRLELTLASCSSRQVPRQGIWYMTHVRHLYICITCVSLLRYFGDLCGPPSTSCLSCMVQGACGMSHAACVYLLVTGLPTFRKDFVYLCLQTGGPVRVGEKVEVVFRWGQLGMNCKAVGFLGACHSACDRLHSIVCGLAEPFVTCNDLARRRHPKA